MNQRLKVFSLVLVAVTAASAATAAFSSAAPSFTAAQYPATVHATRGGEIGSEAEYFEAIGRKIECEVSHLHGTLTGASASLTMTIDITDHSQGGNCRAGGTLVTTIKENGCDLRYTVTGTVPGQTDYLVGVDTICGEGKATEIIVRNLLNTADACTITVGSQNLGPDLTGRNNSGHIDLSGTREVKSTVHSKNTAICGVEAGKSAEKTTNYVINVGTTLTATPNTISLSD